MNTIKKEALYLLVTRHDGVPLDPDLYSWDEMGNMFWTKENNLDIDFSKINNATVRMGKFSHVTVGNNCVVISGGHCNTFKSGDNCVFIGDGDRFETGDNCKFVDNMCGKYNTGSGCGFLVLDGDFNVGDECHIVSVVSAHGKCGNKCTIVTNPKYLELESGEKCEVVDSHYQD